MLPQLLVDRMGLIGKSGARVRLLCVGLGEKEKEKRKRRRLRRKMLRRRTMGVDLEVEGWRELAREVK